MDFEQLKDRYSPFIRQYKIPLLLGLVGFVFIVYGLIQSTVLQHQNEDILAESASDQQVANVDENKITVDVEGSVIKPGVYKLKTDARIQDALIAAGGMSGEADREKVSKTLNLASKVVDGGKVYIPSQNEAISGFSSDNGEVAGDSTSLLININTASESELDSLSGVGPVTASKIVANRPYGSIEELVSKKVIGQSVFSKIKDKISVY